MAFTQNYGLRLVRRNEYLPEQRSGLGSTKGADGMLGDRPSGASSRFA